MVKYYQRKAFLDMLAWSEGTDGGRPENEMCWRHCGRAVTWLLRCPRKLAAKPQNSNQQARTLPGFFPVGGMPTASSLAWKTSLRKVGTLWHCSRLSGALPVIDRGDIRQAIDRCGNIWASLPGAGYGQFEHKADSLIAKFKEAGGTVRDWCMSRVTANYLRSSYLHHRLPVMGC